MTGQFPLYDKEYAATSKTGWYEVMKWDKEWLLLEVYTDGSCDKRGPENSKKEARRALEILNRNNELPFYVDHGTKIYHEVI